MAEDHNLKVILKQFPILSDGSVDAARIAVLVGEDPKINYWDFHQKMFAERGEVGASQALQVAEQLGGNRAELMLDIRGRTGGAARLEQEIDEDPVAAVRRDTAGRGVWRGDET